ncbi:MAG: OprO/OprP family phosphate-selective porin [Planctomycetota bacterium]|jgi:phosphate-selective porin OprO/OprP
MKAHIALAAAVVLLAATTLIAADPPKDPAPTTVDAAASTAPAEPVDPWMSTYDLLALGDDVHFYWKQGIHLDMADKAVKLKVGGRLLYDYGWINAPGIRSDRGMDLEDEGEFRRIRLYLSGNITEFFDFKLQLDFAEAGTTMKDFWVRLKKIPYAGNFKIGYFKEPFSLENLTSSKYVTFIERALPNSFAPDRSWGMAVNNHAFDKRMTWAFGAFRQYVRASSPKFGSSSRGRACALTGRVTFLPFFEDKNHFFHTGVSYSLRRPKSSIKFDARPEAHMTKKLTSTGNIDADRVHLLGGELAYVRGPFSAQAEYIAAGVDVNSGGDDLWLSGLYFQTSYVLTGESRPYDTKTGTFKGIKPKKNFLTGGGIGAWEVAARYSFLDLNKGDVSTSAHRMQNFTVGLNWYLNPNVRISGNYIRSCLAGPLTSDAADIFLLRFQMAF